VRQLGLYSPAVGLSPCGSCAPSLMAGAPPLRDIAEVLNARGITTARGGRWHATSVKNVLERLN
jgi:Recombinase